MSATYLYEAFTRAGEASNGSIDAESEQDAVVSLRGKGLLVTGIKESRTAGLGKTTVWAASVAAVREAGARVVQSSPAEAESRLSYSGLADLLADDLAAVRSALPPPQARALAVAMRIEDPGDRPADETAVARGLLEALRALARTGSLLVAIDDVRWLDGPTLAAVLYAARRVDPRDRVRFLTTQRTGAPEPPNLDDPRLVERIRLEPLTVGGIHRVLRLHAGLSLPRPRLLEIHAASGGNPLHALELARALETGAPVSGGSLASLYRARLAALPESTARAVLLLAASADRSTARLERAYGDGFGAALAPALAADLVAIEAGHVRPAHPLITHLAYETAAPADRRNAHRALAATASNEEERALHLGRSVDVPDAQAADRIEAAAGEARARGVRALAASLYESAARLTPDEARDDRARRLLAAASAWFDSGDTDRVEAILEPLIESLPLGSQRCEAQWRLGKALDEAGRWREAVALWNEALAESGDLALRSQVLCSLAITALYTDSIQAALRHYRAVLNRATAAGDANVEQWAAFGLAWSEIVVGDFRAAEALADTVLDIADQTHVMRIPARTLRAHVDAWLGDLPAARAVVGEAIAWATAADEATHLFGGLAILGTIESFAGDFTAAARAFKEARILAVRLGLAHASALRTLLAEVEAAAAAGDPGQARAALEAFRSTAGARPPAWVFPIALRAEAAIALADGDPGAAIAALEASLAAPDLPAPDRARSLLALGTARRRNRELARARETLTEARAAFAAIGTPPWIAAVDRELGRIPGRRRSDDPELTTAEARIAELVAAGRSNRDAAAELTLSVKTIEVTLTRVYEKLGVRSRSELAAHYRRAATD
jgi:DNA-binding CsgD family transcriptional regulator/tetratricopeptide (TPR) repeat protein